MTPVQVYLGILHSSSTNSVLGMDRCLRPTIQDTNSGTRENRLPWLVARMLLIQNLGPINPIDPARTIYMVYFKRPKFRRRLLQLKRALVAI